MMTRNSYRITNIANVGFIMALLCLLTACEQTPDEEQIKQNIAAMQTAVENKKVGEIGDYLHKDFMANRSMNAKQVKQMLLMHGMQHNTISVTIVSSETKVDPVYTEKAESTLSVITTGSSGRLPTDGSLRVVELEWRKVSGDWKILKASWEY